MTVKLQMGFTTETRKAQQRRRRRRSLGFSTLQFVLKLFTPCCKPKSLFLAFLQDFDHCCLSRLPRRRIKRELTTRPDSLTNCETQWASDSLAKREKACVIIMTSIFFMAKLRYFFEKEFEKFSDFFCFSSVNSTNFVSFFWVKFSKKFRH